jgi:hypothetical protein
MASQRVFQLGLRRAAAPSFRIQPAGRTIQKRYVFQQLFTIADKDASIAAVQHVATLKRRESIAECRFCGVLFAIVMLAAAAAAAPPSRTTLTHNPPRPD